jgi:hypothetical protein
VANGGADSEAIISPIPLQPKLSLIVDLLDVDDSETKLSRDTNGNYDSTGPGNPGAV